MIFHGGEQSEDVFLELEADELLRPHVAHCPRSGGVGFVPGVDNGLGQKVNPAAVGGREGKGGTKGGRGYGDRCLIELEHGQTRLLEGRSEEHTLINMSL